MIISTIIDYGKIRKATAKSDFIACLEKIGSFTAYKNTSTDVIDGPAFVHMNAPTVSNTYGQYCKKELAQRVKDIARNVNRVDLVFDIYRTISIKRETRESRGSEVRISVR